VAPYDIFLFTKKKTELKGTRIESVKAIKLKATEILNKLTQEDFLHYFTQWNIRIWSGVEIAKGKNNVSIVI